MFPCCKYNDKRYYHCIICHLDYSKEYLHICEFDDIYCLKCKKICVDSHKCK